jgi:hypothetical protein
MFVQFGAVFPRSLDMQEVCAVHCTKYAVHFTVHCTSLRTKRINFCELGIAEIFNSVLSFLQCGSHIESFTGKDKGK